jgi:hypothetical protein
MGDDKEQGRYASVADLDLQVRLVDAGHLSDGHEVIAFSEDVDGRVGARMGEKLSGLRA